MTYLELRKKIFLISEAYGIVLTDDMSVWIPEFLKVMVNRGVITQKEANAFKQKFLSPKIRPSQPV